MEISEVHLYAHTTASDALHCDERLSCSCSPWKPLSLSSLGTHHDLI